MYDIDACGEMINDAVRTGAYERALRAVVRPDSVVVDIGTGAGILAMIACRLGARVVYAIEIDPVIALAREIAQANGVADRIVFMRGASRQLALPERADVVVSDLHGALPFFRDHLPTVIDARSRFLAPGGQMVPRVETLSLAIAQVPEVHSAVTEPWLENRLGLDMRAGHVFACNRWGRVALRASDLLTSPAACGAVDYREVAGPDFACAAVTTATRAGTGHGVCVWFDSELAEDVRLSNAPNGAALAYGQGFFRWPRAVAIEPGDRVAIRMRATLVDEDYVWSWESVVADAAGGEKERFRQSTFQGAAIAADDLRKVSSTHAPSLSVDGEVERLALESMDGSRTLADIARLLVVRFPAQFPSFEGAFKRVCAISTRCGT